MEKIGYLLIDAYNMAFKAVHIHDGMKTSSGKDSSVIHGVLQQIASVRSIFQRYLPVVVWDSGHVKRTKLSSGAVELGIVPERYKQNREAIDPFKQSVHDQVPALKSILSCTDIPQVVKEGYEADDVIGSYCAMLKSKFPVIAFTHDDDYFQLLDDNVVRVTRMKGEQTVTTKSKFIAEYGIEPGQWVDVGALCGDDGDNIFGVPSCGEVTAVKLIKQYGSYSAVVDHCMSIYDGLRKEYPDLNKDEINKLISCRGDNRSPYTRCSAMMPYTGVALAIEQKKVRNPAKLVELIIALHRDRIKLAYALKKMYCGLKLPEPKLFNRWNDAQFKSVCAGWELQNIDDLAQLFSCSEIDRD